MPGTGRSRAGRNASARGVGLRSFRARRRRPKTHYFAFLSYSHRDEELAEWLHREIERFRVPAPLVGRLTANGPIPRRLTPIFRDEQELAAADDLGGEIEAALEASRFLIVLCSPAAAASRWTNAEIALFKKSSAEGCVLAAIAAGEPFASEVEGRETEECFPPALRFKLDRRGRQTAIRAEPLAADLREPGEARRIGVLKIIAGMLGVGLDELVRRETTQRHRKMAFMTAGSLAGTAIAIALAIAAVQARDAARDERREAEGLVAFMLGDLKEKLEPIGRLDALDGVGSRVLEYYSKQDAAELSDAALLQRSRALSLTAQVSLQRGNLEQAARLYGEAMAGTREAIRRDPRDAQRLFDHAQNVAAIGEIARQRGQTAEMQRQAEEYQQLAEKMVALQPDNMKWRMEAQYADANLGIALYQQRRFAEASVQFERALRTIEALATADPGNRGYRQSTAESLAWLADARMSEGKLDQAIQLRQRHVAMLRSQLANSSGDVAVRQMLVPALRALGNLQEWRGQHPAAEAQMRMAVTEADALVRIEPDNSQWQGAAARARLNLAEILADARRTSVAKAEAEQACEAVATLVARDGSVVDWRRLERDCDQLRARIALAEGDPRQSMRWAMRSLAAARAVSGGDTVSNNYALARSLRIIGDARRALGDGAGARIAWQTGIGRLGAAAAERPSEMSEHLALLERLGRRDEAKQVAARLQSIGYQVAG